MSDLHAVAVDLSRLASADYQPLLKQIGAAVLKNIDSRTPYKSGQLVRGNSFEVMGNDAVSFSNDVLYAGYVHNGTKPHVILPKFALASSAKEIGGGSHVLVFDIGGTTVFTNVVRHPGTQAQPFITQGIDDSIPMIEAMGVRYVDTLLGAS